MADLIFVLANITQKIFAHCNACDGCMDDKQNMNIYRYI